MLVTQEMIWNEIQETKKLVSKLLEEKESFDISEISLNKACKLLRLGNATILRLVKSKKLEARTYRDTNHKTRYRFLLKDIKKFQESNKYHQTFLNENAESAEDIANRIFNKPERKAS